MCVCTYVGELVGGAEAAAQGVGRRQALGESSQRQTQARIKHQISASLRRGFDVNSRVVECSMRIRGESVQHMYIINIYIYIHRYIYIYYIYIYIHRHTLEKEWSSEARLLEVDRIGRPHGMVAARWDMDNTPSHNGRPLEQSSHNGRPLEQPSHDGRPLFSNSIHNSVKKE
jgi:hypothetical protein